MNHKFKYIYIYIYIKVQFGNVVHFVASYHPLNYYFIKGERVRKIKMKNREILINPGKKKQQQQQRERGGCWLLIEDWIGAEQIKGRYCIREDFSIFRCFFVLHFEESWFARDFFFFFLIWFGNSI